MGTSGFVLGIVAIIGVIFSFIVPYISEFIPFEWYHWFNLPIALFGLILSSIGFIKRNQVIFAVFGVIFNIASIITGLILLL
jgi:ABC-type multidrug transport system permease subunit